MRPDVKLGVVVSSVVVLVAGTYYFYRDKQEAPIAVAAGQGPQDLAGATPAAKTQGQKKVAGKKRSLTKAKPKTGRRRTDKRLAQKRPASKLPKPATPMATTAGSKKSAANLNRNAAAKRLAARNTGKVRQRLAARRGAVPGHTPPATLAGRSPAKHPTARNAVPTGTAKKPISLTATRPASVNPKAAPSTGAAIETHRVQRGDTLTSLAQRYYGDKSLARFLAKNNPQIVNPTSLGLGQLVKIPPRPVRHTTAKPATTKPSKSAKPRALRRYTVKSGDSFYKIAKDVLGDSSRWNELFELNRKLVNGDPKRLKPGQQVTLPAK